MSQAKLQRLERSNAHLRKQRAQMMADFQVSFPLSCCISAQHRTTIFVDLVVAGLLYMAFPNGRQHQLTFLSS